MHHVEKSTLLSVLAGRRAPDSGSVRHRRGVRVRLLGQESQAPSPRPAFEVYDAAVARLVSSGTLPPAERVGLAQLGLLPSEAARRPVTELSVGQQRRLGLALVLAARPHLVLLDEPTNHLSMTLVEELTEALGVTRAAVVVATHGRPRPAGRPVRRPRGGRPASRAADRLTAMST